VKPLKSINVRLTPEDATAVRELQADGVVISDAVRDHLRAMAEERRRARRPGKRGRTPQVPSGDPSRSVRANGDAAAGAAAGAAAEPVSATLRRLWSDPSLRDFVLPVDTCDRHAMSRYLRGRAVARLARCSKR